MFAKIKDEIIAFALLVGSLLAGIWYLFTKNQRLIEDAKRKQIEHELEKTRKEVENAKKKSDSATAKWDAFKSKYGRGGDGGGVPRA